MDQKIENLSQSLVWLNLLYYEKTNAGYRSHVSNEHFFLKKEEGKTNPSLELRTLIEKIKDPNLNSKERLDIHCQFPARILFLKKYFTIDDGKTCPLIEQWKQSYRPKDLYLVYASQYISNPASAFGHSFLVISSDAVSEGLWLSHNYAAAIPQDVNPFSYVYGGMVGWFTADYSILPFYQRLFQYGSVENRNLWMYKIKLSSEELNFYIAHMWELVHQAKFTYYFMDENCAGALLRTFAALFDDMRNAKDLPIYIQPIDVVKELDRAGRVENLKLEPSQFRVLSDKLEHLNSKQYQIFKTSIRTETPPPVGQVDQALAESLIEYTSYLRKQNFGKLPEEYKDIERTSYILRSKMKGDPLPFDPEVYKMDPRNSHKRYMSLLGASTVNGLGTLDLGFRFTAHGLIDRDAGFLKNSSIEGFRLETSFHGSELWIKDLSLVNIENYPAVKFFEMSPSWKVHLGIQENLLTKNLTDHFARIDGGVGYSADFLWGLYYLLISPGLNFGQDLSRGQIELGPLGGAIYDLGPMKLRMEVNYGRALFESQSLDFLRIRNQFRYALSKNLSWIQEGQWEKQLTLQKEGYRIGTSLRAHF